MLRPNLKKYATKKRLVVRFTNTKIIAQVIEAYSQGDKILCCYTTNHLKNYGLNLGLTNYSAAYALGLLIGKFTNQTVFLDIGLKRNTKGSKAYAVLKGAVDSGMQIPHNAERIFPENLNDRIFGKTVIDYMNLLKGTDKYSQQFGLYEKNNIGPDNLKDFYENAFERIRKGEKIEEEKKQ